jgi:hypothetical protein
MSERAASLLAELDLAVRGSHPDRAADVALEAFREKVPPVEVVRTAARAFAAHDDGSAGAPRALVALASALGLGPRFEPRLQPLPILQAVYFAASERKADRPPKSPAVVSGEVTHLGRSFVFAVRAGDRAEAESIFLGMVTEGRERKMAGDMLFRAAIEDMGEGGRKLMVSVKSWQLARSLGFRDVRALLRPAVQYLVRGPRDRAPFEAILSALGKEWVDLEALASGGHPLDEAGRGLVRGIAAAPDPPAAITGTLSILREGYAAVSVAEGLAVEAARRVIAVKGDPLDTARGLMYAHAARFVLSFSRTDERLYALFQAALRIRSPEPSPPTTSVRAPSGESEELRHLSDELDARKPAESVARTRAYLAQGYTASRLLDLLATHACHDSAVANGAFNLIFADVCATEFVALKAPEIPMALAKVIAASPKDSVAFASWAPRLPA